MAGPRDYDITLHGDRTVFQSNDGGPWFVTNPTTSTPSKAASLVVNNPGKRKKPSSFMPTSRSLSKLLSVRCYGTKTFTQGFSTRRVFREVGPDINGSFNQLALSPLPSIYETLLNEAILDALGKLKNGQFNAGVAIAESAGLARMLTDAAQLVTKTRYDLRHGNFKEAYERFRSATNYMDYPSWRRKYMQQAKRAKSVRRAKYIPEGWLYYHFGLKPTINDIDGAAQEYILGQQANPHARGGLVKGYAKNQLSRAWSVTTDPSIYHLRQKYVESVRVSIPVFPKNPVVMRLSELGATNPAEAIYNGLPFSWVVDYFTSVGDYLSVLDTHLSWELGTVVSAHRRLINGTEEITVGPKGLQCSYSPGVFQSKQIKRTLVNNSYGPLGGVLPSLKRRGPDATKIANMLSVLATSFKQTIRP